MLIRDHKQKINICNNLDSSKANKIKKKKI